MHRSTHLRRFQEAVHRNLYPSPCREDDDDEDEDEEIEDKIAENLEERVGARAGANDCRLAAEAQPQEEVDSDDPKSGSDEIDLEPDVSQRCLPRAQRKRIRQRLLKHQEKAPEHLYDLIGPQPNPNLDPLASKPEAVEGIRGESEEIKAMNKTKKRRLAKKSYSSLRSENRGLVSTTFTAEVQGSGIVIKRADCT